MATVDDFISAIIKPQRKFGSFVAQVTIEEFHIDDLTITEHPVEQGASISDHAFKRPSELIVRMGWSNSAIAAGLTSAGGLAAFSSQDLSTDLNYVKTIYSKLLALQASRIPFSIVTGKRVYNTMLCASLSVPVRDSTEHALVVTARCREVILVQTQTATLPPADVQANPSETAAPVDQGQQQPVITAFTLNEDGTVGPQVPIHQ